MDILPKSYKRFIVLSSILTSLAVALVFNVASYGLTSNAQTPLIGSIPIIREITPNFVVRPLNTNTTQLITITGTNFSPNATVYFSGITLQNITVDRADPDNNIITATIPNNTLVAIRSGNIVVTNPGRSSSIPRRFYIYNPVPTLNNISPTNAQALPPVRNNQGKYVSSGTRLEVRLNGEGFIPNISQIVISSVAAPDRNIFLGAITFESRYGIRYVSPTEIRVILDAGVDNLRAGPGPNVPNGNTRQYVIQVYNPYTNSDNGWIVNNPVTDIAGRSQEVTFTVNAASVSR